MSGPMRYVETVDGFERYECWGSTSCAQVAYISVNIYPKNATEGYVQCLGTGNVIVGWTVPT